VEGKHRILTEKMGCIKEVTTIGSFTNDARNLRDMNLRNWPMRSTETKRDFGCTKEITNHWNSPICTGQESGLLTRADGTDTLSQNVGKQLPHDAA
jgi:hypothetical protein